MVTVNSFVPHLVVAIVYKKMVTILIIEDMEATPTTAGHACYGKTVHEQIITWQEYKSVNDCSAFCVAIIV